MKILTDMLSEIKKFLSIIIYKGNDISITIGTFLTILVSCFVAYYILVVVRKILTAHLPPPDRNKFISIFRFVNYLVYLLVVIIVLSSSGVNLTVLFTASAALFVGLGFALQFLFQDLISGIIIIIDQSLHVGDIIEVEGKVARVSEIKLRTTIVVTRNDKVIVIPNHKFLTESIFNYTQNSKITREFVQVGVAYGSNVALVKKLLLESLEGVSDVLKNPQPFVLFENFADSSLLFSLYFFTDNAFLEPRIKSDIRFNIDEKFRKHTIVIPFPQTDVHLYQHKST